MQTEAVVEEIVVWLKNYCDTAGMNGFVAGVSGGIDSAVTSTLCARTGKDVIALNLPLYQIPEQVDLADAHIRWLAANHANVRREKIDLTSSFQALEKSLPQEIQDGLTMANTRSRLRMLTLYAFAGHNRLLVAGTGNKVEDFGVGFYTKYGDGGVDISPIADLLKSEVYEIGAFLGVMDGILKASPTDGLWGDNRTDEGQIGATYAELEWAMSVESDSDDTLALDRRQKEVLSIYRRLNRSNRHKMEAIPVFHVPESLR